MDTNSGGAVFYSIIFIPIMLLCFGIAIFSIVCWWKIYKKAGYQGWESIIPIYNAYILLKIVGTPWWWLLLFCIPVVNIIYVVWTTNLLSKSFGKETGFTLGLIFLSIIFAAILAFDRNIVYRGPAGDPTANNPFDEINTIGKKPV